MVLYFLLPVIAAFAVGHWVASAILVLLAAIMALELRSLLALPPEGRCGTVCVAGSCCGTVASLKYF